MSKNRGTIKVMVGRNGIPRIQEELGDSIKIYSEPDWRKELERRREEDIKNKGKEDKKEKPVKKVVPKSDEKVVPKKYGKKEVVKKTTK